MPVRSIPESVPVTVAQVYGRSMSQLSTQLGRRQQFSDFALVGNTAVTFLALDGTVKRHNPSSAHKFGGPRLIITERVQQRVVFNPTGQVARPTFGQPYLNDDGGISYGTRGMTDSYPTMTMSTENAS